MNTLTGDELLDLYIEAWTKLDAEIIIPHLASILLLLKNKEKRYAPAP